jgi:hypothetical protein
MPEPFDVFEIRIFRGFLPLSEGFSNEYAGIREFSEQEALWLEIERC